MNSQISEGMEGLFWVLMVFYSLQIGFGLYNCTAPNSKQKENLATHLFGGGKKLTKTWSKIVVVFMIPVIISASVTIFERSSSVGFYEAAFFGCLSMLFVLVTLELSVINAINSNNKDPWQNLVVFALVLDLVAIGVLVFAIKPAALSTQDVTAGIPANWDALSFFISGVGLAAFFSSFLIVLFTMAAGEMEQVENQDGP